MKIGGRQAEAFLARPDPAVAAVLLYGADGGLVRERAERIVQTVAGDPTDPFQVSELTASMLRDDPARLADEAAALTLGGGRRVIRLRDGTDAVAVLVEAVLAGAAPALLVVEAGELGPKSPLRRLFESSERAAALPCYRDEGADLSQIVADELHREGLTVAPEALRYLVDNLGSDRGVTRAELRKLALYMGPAARGARVELVDAVASIGDNAALSLDDLVFAVGDGDLAGVERSFRACLQEGSNEVSVLRAVGRHLLRLHFVRATMRRGIAQDRAMAALRPPVFYKFTSRFAGQIEHWTEPALAAALERLTIAEQACKRTGAPAEALSHRALMQVAQQAARQTGPGRGRVGGRAG